MSKFPYEITDEANSKVPLIRVGPQGWVLHAKFRDVAEKVYNFPVKPEHVWVIGFPRSGTSMTQELVWLIHNNVDFEAAKESSQKRVNFLDSCFVRSTPMPDDPELQDKSTRNVIKSHLSFELLPPTLLDTCKVVFIARNPKDTAVSFFNFKPYYETFEEDWLRFPTDKVVFGPFWKYTMQGWGKRDHPNVLFLFYEDIVRDMRGAIEKVAMHLGRVLTEEQISKLEEYMKFDNFKKNDAVNHHFLRASGEIPQDFIRKGGVGGWRDYFSQELNGPADQWIAKNVEGTDFAFPEN